MVKISEVGLVLETIQGIELFDALSDRNPFIWGNNKRLAMQALVKALLISLVFDYCFSLLAGPACVRSPSVLCSSSRLQQASWSSP